MTQHGSAPVSSHNLTEVLPNLTVDGATAVSKQLPLELCSMCRISNVSVNLSTEAIGVLRGGAVSLICAISFG